MQIACNFSLWSDGPKEMQTEESSSFETFRRPPQWQPFGGTPMDWRSSEHRLSVRFRVTPLALATKHRQPAKELPLADVINDGT
jgi:hypothetical protein